MTVLYDKPYGDILIKQREGQIAEISAAVAFLKTQTDPKTLERRTPMLRILEKCLDFERA